MNLNFSFLFSVVWKMIFSTSRNLKSSAKPNQTKYIQYSCVNISRFDLKYLDLKYIVTDSFSLVIRVHPHHIGDPYYKHSVICIYEPSEICAHCHHGRSKSPYTGIRQQNRCQTAWFLDWRSWPMVPACQVCVLKRQGHSVTDKIWPCNSETP